MEPPGALVSPTFVDRYRSVATFTRVYVDLRDAGATYPRSRRPCSGRFRRRAPRSPPPRPTRRSSTVPLPLRPRPPDLRPGRDRRGLPGPRAGGGPPGRRRLRRRPGPAGAGPAPGGGRGGRRRGHRRRNRRCTARRVVVAIAASPIFPLGLAAERGTGARSERRLVGSHARRNRGGGRHRGSGAGGAGLPGPRRPTRRPAPAGSGLPNGRRALERRRAAERRARYRTRAAIGSSPGHLGVGGATGPRRGSPRARRRAGVRRSLDHLVSSPDLYGWNWDLSLDGFDLGSVRLLRRSTPTRDLAAWAPGATGRGLGRRSTPSRDRARSGSGRDRTADHRRPRPGRRRRGRAGREDAAPARPIGRRHRDRGRRATAPIASGTGSSVARCCPPSA